MTIRNIAKRTLTLLMATFLVLGSITPLNFTQEAEAAAKAGYSTNLSNDAREVKVTSGTYKGAKGYCASPGVPAKSSGTAEVSLVNNENVRRVAYYIDKTKLYGSSADAYGVCEARIGQWLLAYARFANQKGGSRASARKRIGNDTFMTDTGKEDKILALIEKMYDSAIKSAIPKTLKLELVFLNEADSGHQDYMAWRITAGGKITLKKKSSNATIGSLSGYNNFSGVSYKVYESDKKTVVGTLTAKSNGTTNTIALAPGTYYAKEATTNAYYKLNTAWIKFEVKPNKTTTVNDTDDWESGTAEIVKQEANGGTLERGDKFVFQLVNSQNSSLKYTVTLTGNGSSSVTGSVSVPAGTYRVTETSCPDEYINVTGSGTVKVPVKGKGTITWKNEKTPDHGNIKVRKVTEDGGPLNGFKFRVTGMLYNNGEITANKVLETITPNITFSDSSYTVGNWNINADDVAALNQAAKDGELDNYNIRLTNTATAADSYTLSTDTTVDVSKTYYTKDGDNYNTVTPEGTENPSELGWYEKTEGETIDLAVTAKVYLKEVVYNAADDEYTASIGASSPQTAEDAKYTIKYNNFNWNGAATKYKDVNTGQPYTILETSPNGQGYRDGKTTPGIDEGVTPGKYTVTEELTSEQAERYHQPESQTLELLDKEGTLSFTFTNKPFWTPVKLKKTSPDGKVAGLQFRLTGTTAFGDEVDETGTTDNEGNIDFGEIYKGSYVVEEISYDADAYLNNYQYPGKQNPAIPFEVTGEEDEDIVIEFENTPKTMLYLTKIDGETYDFLENAKFELYDGDEVVARFQIVENDDGTAGLNMMYAKAPITGKMEKTLADEGTDTNGDGIEDIDPSDVNIQPDESDQGGSGDSGDSDDQSSEGQDSGDQGGQDSGSQDGQSEDETPALDPDVLNYAVLRNLEVGKTYTLKEIGAPKGYTPLKPIEFIFENEQRMILENFMPKIGTVATEKESGKHIVMQGDKAIIQDVVTYEHLIPNTEYTMKGSLVYKTGEEQSSPVMSGGKPVETSKKFTTSDTGSGSITLEFELDTKDLPRGAIVAFEECYDTSNKLIASHKDVEDPEQTVDTAWYNMYKVRNEDAPEKSSSKKYGFAWGDTVTYTAVIENGGSVDLRMDVYDEFDDSEYFSTPVVISVAGATVNSKSEDGNTVNITVPAGKTAKVVYSSTIQDNVPQYLADAAKDSDSLKDGKDCNKADRNNKPDEYDGYRNSVSTKNVEYKDPREPDDPWKEYPNGDKKDDAQTPVKVGDIDTNAIDSETEDHITYAGKNVVIIDTVTYKGLVPGREYELQGTLMVKEANKALRVGGKVVKSEPLTFVPAEASGQEEIAFEFDATGLDGKSLVAFEELYADGILVADHKDINDDEQTVLVPKILTIAALRDKEVVDTIEYTNLLPNRKYVARGYLVDPKTGMKLKGSDGSTEFTAKATNGTVKVTLPINGYEKLRGKKLVAFEECYIVKDDGTEVLIGTHFDTNDKKQTVTIPRKPSPDTGDNNYLSFYVGLMVMSVALGAGVAAGKRRRVR